MGWFRTKAFGSYSDGSVEVFMNKVFGARKLNMTYDISEFLKSFISEFIAEAIARIGIVVLDRAINYRKLTDVVCLVKIWMAL